MRTTATTMPRASRINPKPQNNPKPCDRIGAARTVSSILKHIHLDHNNARGLRLTSNKPL